MPVEPEVVDNRYGDPYVDVVPTAPGVCSWMEEYAGRQGVLHAPFCVDLMAYVPNCPCWEFYKDVRLEVVWHSDGMPTTSWEPDLAAETIGTWDEGDGWYRTVVEYERLDFNPPEEWLTLCSNGGEIYLDSLTITTSAALGDMDCDGDVDFDDIDPFVQALTDSTAYTAAHPECNYLLADCDESGELDFDDINSFIELLGT